MLIPFHFVEGGVGVGASLLDHASLRSFTHREAGSGTGLWKDQVRQDTPKAKDRGTPSSKVPW